MKKLFIVLAKSRTYHKNYYIFKVTSPFASLGRRIFVVLALFVGVVVTPSSAFAATLSLSPASGTFNRGCSFKLNINVDTGGAQTDGTDAIVRFDPTRVSATQISPGTIYNDYPGTNIDATGKITISGLASVSAPFSGSGTLASVDFNVPSAAPTGATAVTFDFDPNDPSKTTDSNVVERNTVRDVLSNVTNGNYTIGTGSCAGQGGGTTGGGTTGGGTAGGGTVATGSGTIPLKTLQTLPPARSEQLTLTFAIVGSVLTILGILGLALL